MFFKEFDGQSEAVAIAVTEIRAKPPLRKCNLQNILKDVLERVVSDKKNFCVRKS